MTWHPWSLVASQSVERKIVRRLISGWFTKISLDFPLPTNNQFIDNVWKPDVLFDFPKSLETKVKLRKFQQEWFVKHPFTIAGLFKIFGWRFLFAVHQFRNGVWQKCFQTEPPFLSTHDVLDNGKFKTEEPLQLKVRNPQSGVLAMQNLIQIQ